MMSYVSVYENKAPRSKGLIMTVTVHAVIIAGVIAMPGIAIPEKLHGPFIATNIPNPQPPEPVIEDDPPKAKVAQPTQSTMPEKPIANVQPFPVTPVPTYSDFGNAVESAGAGDGIPFEAIKIVPDPVMVGARLDSRYADRFQPAYPAGQLRFEREAEISVRVLVGGDGRVKQIELIDSPHEDFWIATRKQALKNWRFTPATRDGKPFESWMTLKVRFEINS